MNILTVGTLVDQLERLPRDMKVWVGLPKPDGGFQPCHCIAYISASPKGDPKIDDCGIILDPKMPYSNL